MALFGRKKKTDELNGGPAENKGNNNVDQNVRIPIQWGDFSNLDCSVINGVTNKYYPYPTVKEQLDDANSILNYYRKLLKFRKEHEVIIYGDFKQYYENSDKLFVYERNLDGEKILVVCSFTDKCVNFEAPAGIDLSKGELVLSNYRLNPVTNNSFVTRPYECRVYYFK